MKRNLTCIICPRGCAMEIDLDTMKVTGNSCPKGEQYAIDECTDPVRTVTSSVRVSNRENTMVSVKTEQPVSKSRLFDVMKEIRAVKTLAPVKIGDIIIKDVYGTNIVATKNID